MIKNELEQLRKILINLIKDTNSGKETIEKAIAISKLSAQYCKVVKIQRDKKWPYMKKENRIF